MCKGNSWLSVGIAVGVAIGVALHNIGLGIGVGLAIGLGYSGFRCGPKTSEDSDGR